MSDLRESIAAALAERDEQNKRCPVNFPEGRGRHARTYRPSDRCERCGATASGTCGIAAGADHRFAERVRTILGQSA